LKSDFLQLPAAATEQGHTDDRNCCFRDGHSGEDTLWAQARMKRQQVRDRNLKQPVTEKINGCRSESVSGTIERLDHHHPVCVGEIPVAEYAETIDTVWDDCRIICEKADDLFRK